MNAFNSADALPKRVGVPNTIPSAHSTSARVGAVLGEHFLAPLLPAGDLGHHRPGNKIGHAAEADFGSGFTGSFTDGFCKCFYRAVTRIEGNENVCFGGLASTEPWCQNSLPCFGCKQEARRLARKRSNSTLCR